jgi:hypothetical protein
VNRTTIVGEHDAEKIDEHVRIQFIVNPRQNYAGAKTEVNNINHLPRSVPDNYETNDIEDET